MELPKLNKSQKTGEIGLTIVKKIVEAELGWIFRRNHQENDFGIDAYIDIITERGEVTGKSIALQIKTGASYFKEEMPLGWVYRGEMSHLNYYLNHEIPVVIILVAENSEEAYWCLIDPNKTDKAGESWKTIVPKKQKLENASKPELLQYIGPTTDYVSQLEHFWAMNKIFKEHDRILLAVEKEEILELDFDNLILAFDRFETSEDLILKLQNKIDVFVHGYDNDERELFEIPEVVQWAIELYNAIDSWPYFLALDKASQFMKILFITHVKFNKIEPGRIEYDKEDAASFIQSVFDKLNAFCDKHGISDETNIEITKQIVDLITEGGFSKSMSER